MPDEFQAAGDWPAYYRATLGREPRPLFWKGVAAIEATGVVPGQAVDIGFGDGTETLALLAAGWRVTAVDPAPAAAETLRSQAGEADADRLEILSAPAEQAELPPFDLLYAGYSLPFLDPASFDGFWAGVRDRLRPGGFLVVNFFGTHDSWYGREGMSFIEREALEPRLEGLDVLAIDEQDEDGNSFLGPKHWHVFDVVARRPGSSAG
jgi:SAM-dependent methyltransferase